VSINDTLGTTECNYANIRTVVPDETNVSLKQGRQFAALSSRSVDHGSNRCIHMRGERWIRDHKLYILYFMATNDFYLKSSVLRILNKIQTRKIKGHTDT
jgi:hypothetical protein